METDPVIEESRSDDKTPIERAKLCDRILLTSFVIGVLNGHYTRKLFEAELPRFAKVDEKIYKLLIMYSPAEHSTGAADNIEKAINLANAISGMPNIIQRFYNSLPDIFGKHVFKIKVPTERFRAMFRYSIRDGYNTENRLYFAKNFPDKEYVNTISVMDLMRHYHSIHEFSEIKHELFGIFCYNPEITKYLHSYRD